MSQMYPVPAMALYYLCKKGWQAYVLDKSTLRGDAWIKLDSVEFYSATMVVAKIGERQIQIVDSDRGGGFIGYVDKPIPKDIAELFEHPIDDNDLVQMVVKDWLDWNVNDDDGDTIHRFELSNSLEMGELFSKLRKRVEEGDKVTPQHMLVYYALSMLVEIDQGDVRSLFTTADGIAEEISDIKRRLGVA